MYGRGSCSGCMRASTVRQCSSSAEMQASRYQPIRCLKFNPHQTSRRVNQYLPTFNYPRQSDVRHMLPVYPPTLYTGTPRNLATYRSEDILFRKPTIMVVGALAKPRLKFNDPVRAFHTDSGFVHTQGAYEPLGYFETTF